MVGVEANHPDRLLVVVTGLPGTGKSTVADAAGRHLGAAVLAHDWAMSGLRPFPELQVALDEMNPPGHGPVGWSILLSLARAQLRRDGPVVLDGVARAPEIELIRNVAAEERARPVVIVTQCVDVYVHHPGSNDEIGASPTGTSWTGHMCSEPGTDGRHSKMLR